MIKGCGMGQNFLFLPFSCTLCWLVSFELFGSFSGIVTAPTLFWRIFLSLAMKTKCKCFRCWRLRVLEHRTISLFLFLVHHFTAISNNEALFFFTAMQTILVRSVFCGLSFGATAVIVGLVSSPSFSKPWVLIFFRGVRQFDRMCQFLDRLNWVIVLEKVTVLCRVNCRPYYGPCLQTFVQHIRWALSRSWRASLS